MRLGGQIHASQQVYRDYSKKSEYYKAEETARKMKLGLWFDKNPIEPKEFRKMNRR